MPCGQDNLFCNTLPHPDPRTFQALWSYEGTAVRPARQFHRSYYDYKFQHTPQDVLCRLYGNCSAGKRPLCLNAGLATCMPGTDNSYCYTGVPYCKQSFVGDMWKDDFN